MSLLRHPFFLPDLCRKSRTTRPRSAKLRPGRLADRWLRIYWSRSIIHRLRDVARLLKFLTWCSGRPKGHFLTGLDGVVLPWHDPLRVADRIVLLDRWSDGRATWGIGRCLGAVDSTVSRVA